MMAMDHKRRSEARCVAVSDVPSAVAAGMVDAANRATAMSRRAQALMAAAGEVALERRWAIIKVEPRRENDVDNLLARAMIEHWLPLRKAEQNANGKRRGGPGQPVWVLAWPGYLMVKIADTADAWHGVRSVKHVKTVLGVDGNPFFFDDAKFLRLKAELATLKASSGPQTLFVEGETVAVKEGPFAGFPALVVAVDQDGGKERALVEVMIFGRAVPVELDLAQLAKRR